MTRDEFIDDLADKMRKTRGARFIAADRLHKKGKFGIIVITILSIYITSITIAISVFPQYFDSATEGLLNIVSIISSISVIALSLVEYAGARQVNAEILNRNALAISRLRAKLKVAQVSNASFTEIKKISEDYENVNSEAKLNHSEKDYNKFLLSKKTGRRRGFGILFSIGYFMYSFLYWISEFWVYITLLIGLPAVIVVQIKFEILQ
jgi:hypothetical protein